MKKQIASLLALTLAAALLAGCAVVNTNVQPQPEEAQTEAQAEAPAEEPAAEVPAEAEEAAPAEEAEGPAVPAAEAYIGTLAEKTSERVVIIIKPTPEEGLLDARITWREELPQKDICSTTAQYQEDGSLYFEGGSHVLRTFDASGVYSDEYLDEEINGLFWYDQDEDVLYWTDYTLDPQENVQVFIHSTEILPAFSYEGEDEYLGAVCRYLTEENAIWYTQADVSIPAPVILRIEDDDSEDIRIWGNFWMFSYSVNGPRLYMESGGEMPGIMHLKKDDDGVSVVSVETAGDGEAYMKDIERFCEGYPGLAEQMAFSHEAMEKEELAMIRYYVESNGLDIDSYQSYGWPAISLETGEEIPFGPSVEPFLLGGFEDPDSFAVTEEAAELLEKAAEGLLGAKYTPIAYLGKQIVAGANHLFLCTITPVVPDAVGKYALVTVYQDPQGEVSIKDIYNSGAEAIRPGLMGGWQETDAPDVTEEAAAALEKAAGSLLGAEYTPKALLATQVVSGTNYSILCSIRAVVPDAEEKYSIVHVYEDLDGNAEITEIYDVYNSREAED